MGDAEHVIDVERLVDELKERVARGRADGAYADDPALRAGVPLALEPVDGAATGPPAATSAFAPAASFPAPRVVYLPGSRYASPRRLIGALVGALRRLVLRLIHPALDDIARQADAAVVSLHARVEWAEAAIPEETRAREGVAFLAEHVERRANDVDAAQRALEEATQEALDDVHSALQDGRADLLHRLDELRAELARLSAFAEDQGDVSLRHGERLERLETATRGQAVAGADTMRGLADHVRELDARTRALEEEVRAAADAFDRASRAPAATN